jgi:hypothetical protein
MTSHLCGGLAASSSGYSNTNDASQDGVTGAIKALKTCIRS